MDRTLGLGGHGAGSFIPFTNWRQDAFSAVPVCFHTWHFLNTTLPSPLLYLPPSFHPSLSTWVPSSPTYVCLVPTLCLCQLSPQLLWLQTGLWDMTSVPVHALLAATTTLPCLPHTLLPTHHTSSASFCCLPCAHTLHLPLLAFLPCHTTTTTTPHYYPAYGFHAWRVRAGSTKTAALPPSP